MKIAPRERLILLIVGLFVLLAALAVLLVWPQYQKQKSLDAQIATAEQQLQTSQTLLAQRQEIKNRAASTDAQWLRLASLVPETPDLPVAHHRAAGCGLRVRRADHRHGVQPTRRRAPTRAYVLIPLEVRIQGTWADTVDYLKSINKLNRGLRAASFTAAVAPAGTGDPVLPNYSVSTTILLAGVHDSGI